MEHLTIPFYKPLTILDIWQGSEYASVKVYSRKVVSNINNFV